MSFWREMSKGERATFRACFGGWALDGMDFQIYSFVIPALIAAWGLTRGQAGVLGTAALLVSAAGGWCAGANSCTTLPSDTSSWAMTVFLCAPSILGRHPRINCAARSEARMTN